MATNRDIRLCMHCNRTVEYDDFEEAWYHTGSDYTTCDPTDPRSRVATPVYLISEEEDIWLVLR